MVDHRDIQIASKEISRMFELDKVDNIVKIQNWFLYCDEKNGSNDMWYINIVMEFCDGGDLRKVIADHRRKELKFKNSVRVSTII
jgi:serine/threonine protein kinase